MIKLKKDKRIKKADYSEKKEYVFDKKTNVVPKKTNRLICAVLSKDKGCYFLYRKMTFKKMKENQFDFFRFKNGMYIIDNEAIHLTKNGVRVSIYMEGISTPLKLSNVKSYTEKVKYVDLYGNEQESEIERIEGLDFDSKILNTFANQRFADIFTKTPKPLMQNLLLILGCVSLVMIGISYALIYVFR